MPRQGAIDIVVNPLTKRILAARPDWSQSFYTQKIGRASADVESVTLEKMLADAGSAFSERDVKKAVEVLRADAEMDRVRNLLFLRHIENPEGLQRQASLQVIFMTQSLERAGDHAKNLAEEVCHFVSGHTIRHVMMGYDKPLEQMFLEWLRRREETQ